MYKMEICYEGGLVTYVTSPHVETLHFLRDSIERKYRNTEIKYRFYIHKV